MHLCIETKATGKTRRAGFTIWHSASDPRLNGNSNKNLEKTSFLFSPFIRQENAAKIWRRPFAAEVSSFRNQKCERPRAM